MADFTKPSAPKLLGSRGALSMVLGEACFLKSRALMELAGVGLQLDFPRSLQIFQGNPRGLSLTREKLLMIESFLVSPLSLFPFLRHRIN